MRYLKIPKNLELYLNDVGPTSKDVWIECRRDADFAADKADRKYVYERVLIMNDFVVLWLCKKQSGVSLSTIEVEFISASQAGREILGSKQLLN